MYRQIDDDEDRLLTKEEEEAFGDGLRMALISDRPNPNRVGCPDTSIIRDLAFRKRILGPEAFERIADHLALCSPCVQDTLVYVELYKYERKKRRVRLAALGLMTAVVLSMAGWELWRMQPKQEIATKSPALPTRPPAEPVAANEGNQQNNQPEVAQFQPAVIELPSRWRGTANPERPIVLQRARLQLEIRLPIGSSEGRYKLRILDKAGKAQKTLEGTARTDNGIASLKVTLDMSTLSPGKYALSVLEPGLNEWVDYPLTVK